MEWLSENYIIVIIISLVLICLLFLFIFLKKSKKKSEKITIDEIYLKSLIETFGTKENIENVSLEGARLVVSVFNLEKANLTELKLLSSGGIFIKEKTIKVLLRYQSSLLKNEIIKKIKGE